MIPAVLLSALTALAGASAMTFGLMLLVGAVDTSDFDSTSATERIEVD